MNITKKLKKTTNEQIAVTGYVIDMDHANETQISIHTGSGRYDYPYVVPNNFVCATLNDDEGNEFYIIAPRSMIVRVAT